MTSPSSHLPDFDALWNYDRPAETEQAFLAILGQTAEDGSSAYRLELLTQIARAQGLQRRFDTAHATLDRVQAALEDQPEGETGTPRVRYLLERGRVFNSAGEPERARPLFLAAWRQATDASQDGYAVDAAHMLGIVEPAEQGLEWNRKALALAEGSDDPRARRWRGSLYNNMGWTHHAAAEYELALAMFESALGAWEADGQTGRLPIARWAIARALRSLGRTQEALARQRVLLEEGVRAGTSDGVVSEEIGECLLALGREEEAQPHFARAWALLSQDAWLAEAEPARLDRLRALGARGEGA
jgi:tetratricopeptide (TPR) repeat protein